MAMLLISARKKLKRRLALIAATAAPSSDCLAEAVSRMLAGNSAAE
jgi:hypothetical protein